MHVVKKVIIWLKKLLMINTFSLLVYICFIFKISDIAANLDARISERIWSERPAQFDLSALLIKSLFIE